MDLELNQDQRAIVDAVEALLAEHVDVETTSALASAGDLDGGLRKALDEAGFLEVALDDETGWLEAALVVEAVARAGGLVDVGAAVLVAPGVCGRCLEGPVAVLESASGGVTRFGAQARTALVDTGGEARLVTLDPAVAEKVETNFGWPIGRVAIAAGANGAIGDSTSGTVGATPGAAVSQSPGAGSGARLRHFARLAIAAECVGAMRGALDVTVAYVKERRQFGRAIGSFQAVQHRFAELAVLVEGSRWLLYDAAWRGDDIQAAAQAAAHATHTAQRVFHETHQLTGAMGYTREHALHLWTMRLPVLRLELGGTRGHRLAAARARWTPQGGAGADAPAG